MFHIKPMFTNLLQKYGSIVKDIIISNSHSFKIKLKIFLKFECYFEHLYTNGTQITFSLQRIVYSFEF